LFAIFTIAALFESPEKKPPPCTSTIAGREVCVSPAGWYMSSVSVTGLPERSGALP
jgi:hypothetical protein